MNVAYRMTLKGFDGFVDTEFADMNTLICAARGEAGVGLPVYVQRRGRMKGELLCALTTRSIPNNCRLQPNNYNKALLCLVNNPFRHRTPLI